MTRRFIALAIAHSRLPRLLLTSGGLRRRLVRASLLATSAAALAATAACGSDPGAQAPSDPVGSTAAAVLGNEVETASCKPADVPHIARGLSYGRIAASSPAFAECITKAFSSFVKVTPPGHGTAQIGPYNACRVTHSPAGLPDPYTPGPGTILASASSPNPVTIACDYTKLASSEGGSAYVGSVPASDVFSRETITLANALGGIQGLSTPCFDNPSGGPCVSDDAYTDIAGTFMHEIMHQHGYDHTGYNPGDACQMPADQLCGIPCAENPYYGSSVPYEVGECVRVVLQESEVHCGSSMHTACGKGSGLGLVSSIFSDDPTCGCVADPASRSTAGVYRPAGAQFNTSPGNTSDMWILSNGAPELLNYHFYFGAGGDVPLMGDWDGDGSVTPGIFRPAGQPYNSSPGRASGELILSNSPQGATADYHFFYGAAGDVPVVGDWDGNGTTTVGVFRPAGATFNTSPGNASDMWILTNDSHGASALSPFYYGAAGDVPVVGDWDGNGASTVGVFRPAGAAFNDSPGKTSGMWILTNDARGASALPAFYFGAAGNLPVVGDWDGNRTSTVGVFRPAGAQFNTSPGNTSAMWILTNDARGASALAPFYFGTRGDLPVVGAAGRM